jgi:hypothetical protein
MYNSTSFKSRSDSFENQVLTMMESFSLIVCRSKETAAEGLAVLLLSFGASGSAEPETFSRISTIPASLMQALKTDNILMSEATLSELF